MQYIFKSLLLLAVTFQLSAQTPKLNSVFITTGGTFQAPGNKVEFSQWKPGESQTTLIDEATGDFSNFSYVSVRDVFWHCGRAAGHPAGRDVIYRVNPLEGKRIDSITNASGASKIASDGMVAAVIYGFGADKDFFRVYLMENLAAGPGYVDPEVPSNPGALIFSNGRFYVGFTRNDSGFIASYNFFGTQLLDKQLYRLGLNGAGIKEIFLSGNRIFAVVENPDTWPNPPKNAGVIEFSPQSGNVSFKKTPSASIAAGIYNGTIFSDFGKKLSTFNTQTFNIDVEPWADFSPSSIDVDKTSGRVIAQETDYFSYGKLHFLNTNGSIAQTVNTPISGSGLGLLYNSAPVAINFNLVTGVDVPKLISLGDSVIDFDNDKVSFSFTQGFPGKLEDNGTGFYTYTPPAGYRGTITLDYNASDGWGDSTSARITINVGNVGLAKLNADWNASIYPNPAADFVEFRFDAQYDHHSAFYLWDITGRRMELKATAIQPGAYRFDVAHLAAGVYRLGIEGTEGALVLPFIKK